MLVVVWLANSYPSLCAHPGRQSPPRYHHQLDHNPGPGQLRARQHRQHRSQKKAAWSRSSFPAASAPQPAPPLCSNLPRSRQTPCKTTQACAPSAQSGATTAPPTQPLLNEKTNCWRDCLSALPIFNEDRLFGRYMAHGAQYFSPGRSDPCAG